MPTSFQRITPALGWTPLEAAGNATATGHLTPASPVLATHMADYAALTQAGSPAHGQHDPALLDAWHAQIEQLADAIATTDDSSATPRALDEIRASILAHLAELPSLDQALIDARLRNARAEHACQQIQHREALHRFGLAERAHWHQDNHALGEQIGELARDLEPALKCRDHEALVASIIEREIQRFPEVASHLRALTKPAVKRDLADFLGKHLGRLTHPDPTVRRRAMLDCEKSLTSTMRGLLPMYLHAQLAIAAIFGMFCGLVVLGSDRATLTGPSETPPTAVEIVTLAATLLMTRLFIAQQMRYARPHHLRLVTLVDHHTRMAGAITQAYQRSPNTQSLAQHRRELHEVLTAGHPRLEALRRPLEDPRQNADQLRNKALIGRSDLLHDDLSLDEARTQSRDGNRTLQFAQRNAKRSSASSTTNLRYTPGWNADFPQPQSFETASTLPRTSGETSAPLSLPPANPPSPLPCCRSTRPRLMTPSHTMSARSMPNWITGFDTRAARLRLPPITATPISYWR